VRSSSASTGTLAAGTSTSSNPRRRRPTTWWKGNLVHIDFLRIQAGVAVEMDVPLRLIGIPAGVKLDGGNLEHIIHDLPIRCIPSKIPESVEVDVNHLGLNEVIHV
jgi:large subunit ribosomal protein L25